MSGCTVSFYVHTPGAFCAVHLDSRIFIERWPSQNANFPPIDPLHFCSPESLHSPRCRLRMYARPHGTGALGEYQVIADQLIEWQRLTLVANQELSFFLAIFLTICYLHGQISNVEKSFPKNTLLFEFPDGFFGLPCANYVVRRLQLDCVMNEKAHHHLIKIKGHGGGSFEDIFIDFGY